jgi:serine/threonine protein kinase
MKRTREEARSVSDVDASVPKSLSAIVSRCLEREPANRYHSAVELLQQLTTWEANPNISAETLSKMISHPIVRVALQPRSSGQELDVDRGRRAGHRAGHLCRAHAAESCGNVVRRGGQGIPPLKQGKYVAILPLKQIGDQKTLGYVADGIREALRPSCFS